MEEKAGAIDLGILFPFRERKPDESRSSPTSETTRPTLFRSCSLLFNGENNWNVVNVLEDRMVSNGLTFSGHGGTSRWTQAFGGKC